MAYWAEQKFLADSALPPPEFRIYDPLNNPQHGRIPTPMGPRGLVDIELLFETVRASVDPNYRWDYDRTNNLNLVPGVHHIYWYAHLYPHTYGDPASPYTFRNLPPNKYLMPKIFENWMHELTEPVPPPPEEVRLYSIEAWHVAKNLFVAADKAMKLCYDMLSREAWLETNTDVLDPDFNGEDRIGQEYMVSEFKRNFRGLDSFLKRNSEIPAEFRIIEHDTTAEQIVRQLRKVMRARRQNLIPMFRPDFEPRAVGGLALSAA